jgi:hypothetical protein
VGINLKVVITLTMNTSKTFVLGWGSFAAAVFIGAGIGYGQAKETNQLARQNSLQQKKLRDIELDALETKWRAERPEMWKKADVQKAVAVTLGGKDEGNPPSS